ncbi:hypothetical protein FQ707_01620 [Bacteroidaceae bacterium HV4-6-C5C]|nr:hypothetical protein FQ707_01620 [Bacteroidaceae bacterium HV4-6-C5C]
MKRTISILLLLLMLVISVRPMMSMHFCQGKMSSVSLLKATGDHSCCGGMNADMEKSSKNVSVASHFVDDHDTCCKTEKVYVATDNFNSQVELSIAKLLPSFVYVGLIFKYLINITEPESLIKAHIFSPPDKLSKKSVDLLALICTFQI